MSSTGIKTTKNELLLINQQIKEKIKICIETNENENTTAQNLWDSVKAVLRGRFKAQHSENEDHGIWSHHFMANRWGNSGNTVRLYFGGL